MEYASRMRLLLLCALATSVAAQQYPPGDDAKSLLLEVRKKVMLTINRLPKYMCTETIDRSTFKPEAKVLGRSCDDLAIRRKQADWKVRLYTSDRLRLDVAISGVSEMYSWAGEDRFRDQSLADLVGDGATSTGAFAAFLSSIFGTNAANFTYNGDVKADGRVLVEFGFRVPLENSSYRIASKLHSGIVPYDGTFLVDPNTFDLARLTVRAYQLPAELNACEDITTLNYGSVRLNDCEFLLPKNVRLQVINANGTELENRTVFSGCHEFCGESSLQFGDVPQIQQGASQITAFRAVALPAGLPVRLALTRSIDTATAAAGDPVKAELTTAIKTKNNSVLVPRGAAVTGRIVQIKRLRRARSESLTLAVKLETVEINGVPQKFDARLQSAVKRRTNPVNPLVSRQDLGSFDQMSDSENPGVGVLEFQDVTTDYVINRGTEIDGLTAKPK